MAGHHRTSPHGRQTTKVHSAEQVNRAECSGPAREVEKRTGLVGNGLDTAPLGHHHFQLRPGGPGVRTDQFTILVP